MNEHKHEEHSTLEVDDSRLPEIEHDQHLPEALFPNEYPKVADDYPNAAPPPPETAKRATICGLRRRTFWIVIAIVFIVVEAAVVGGAVGGTRGSRPANSSSTTTASTATPTTTTTPASKPTPSNRLSLNSKLSSLYFTDANNVDHYWVYFQISTKAIYQSAWNSSAQIWAVSPVTSADRDVKDQTSIAANIYYHSSSQIDFRIFFFDSKSHIQALSCDLSSVPCDGLWKPPVNDPSNSFTAASTSQLVYYGRECDGCPDANFLIYEDTQGALQKYDNGSVPIAAGLPGFPQPISGSALAIMPIFWSSVLGFYFSSDHFASDPGDLNLMLEVTWVNGTWFESRTFTPTIPPNASIAAFSLASHQLHLLYTNSDSSNGGISVIELYSDNLWQNSSQPSVFASVPNYSAIAVNQAGRVYAIMEDGTGQPMIMEWAFDGQRNYTKVGPVATNPS